jgi:TonB family protein
MTANYSSAARTFEYQLTILDNKPLLPRLAVQIEFARSEFRRDPRGFATQIAKDLISNKAVVLAIIVIAVVALLVIDNASRTGGLQPVMVAEAPEVVLMDMRNGPSLVGFNEGTGQGSAQTPRAAQGGGTGGNHDRNPPQKGELPPPSPLVAAIPLEPPITQPPLPAAGIVIDPALWKDLKAPVYGDPRVASVIPSKGPGEAEGIGTNRGVGIGEGDGPGVGPGSGGNTGCGHGRNGCCGDGTGGGSAGSGFGVSYSASTVDQRARLLWKPEPQYTEEARRNQITGTVVLRAIFASSGEVVQLRAINSLPFGLTERAIAAARQIKFTPAMKDGRAVSVYMNLEYNFNLY